MSQGARNWAAAGRARIPALAVVTHESLLDLRENHSGHLGVAQALGTDLIAVDNGSRDGSLALLRESATTSKRLCLQALPRNAGYAVAVNRAFAAAEGRDVLLINPDVKLDDPTAVEALAQLLAERPTVGVLAPALVGPAGTRQPTARSFPSLRAMLGSLPVAGRMLGAAAAYEAYMWPVDGTRTARVEWVIGAAMLIRREAYEAVGGWDERFFLYMEDADFCRRIGAAGFEVQFEPSVSLIHGYARASSAAGQTVLSSRARRRHFASLARFWSREPRLLLNRRVR